MHYLSYVMPDDWTTCMVWLFAENAGAEWADVAIWESSLVPAEAGMAYRQACRASTKLTPPTAPAWLSTR